MNKAEQAGKLKLSSMILKKIAFLAQIAPSNLRLDTRICAKMRKKTLRYTSEKKTEKLKK